MTTHATHATVLPPGIESPNEVETRLGTLRFFDGSSERISTGRMLKIPSRRASSRLPGCYVISAGRPD